MIKFKGFELYGNIYNIPQDITKVKIGRYIKYLNKIFQHCPDELNAVCDLQEGETLRGKFDALPAQAQKKCYDYFVKVVSFWSGAPEQKLKNLDLKTLELAFWGIEYLFGSYKPNEEFAGFEVDGVEYLLPEKHMVQSTLIEFAEAAQYEENVKDLKAGNHIAILDNMAILCRPKGEQYDDKNNEKRKKIFFNVGLDVGLNVCFFLTKLNVSLNQTLLIYSLLAGPQVEQVKQ
jgi:hypothetical protein